MLREEVVGVLTYVNVHFNFHLNISDNEHEAQGSRLGKVTPPSSTFLECLWPFATGASVVMWNPQRPAYNYGQYHWIRQVQTHSLYLYCTRGRQSLWQTRISDPTKGRDNAYRICQILGMGQCSPGQKFTFQTGDYLPPNANTSASYKKGILETNFSLAYIPESSAHPCTSI